LHTTLEALDPLDVGAGSPVIPRAELTSLAVGHERAEPEAGVGVEAAAVGAEVPAAALDAGDELLVVPPQAATAREQRIAAPAATPRR
jgi:hypothetical protein